MKHYQVGDIVRHKSAHGYVGIVVDTNSYQTTIRWGDGRSNIYPHKYMVGYIENLNKK